MLKKILGQTAIYGLSSVIIRVFPFVIAPIITQHYGAVATSPFTDFYSMAGVIAVLLTHGMETSFFRFAQEITDKAKLFSTTALSVMVASLLFLICGYFFRTELAIAFKTPDQVHFLSLFLFILCIDGLSAMPFAILRKEGRAIKYAIAKVSGASINFLLVWFFIVVFPTLDHGILGFEYSEKFGVGYAFVANLAGTIFTFLVLSKELVSFNIRKFDVSLWFKMFKYSWPIMIAGLAGIVNMTLDRQFLKYWLPELESRKQIGIYGGVYRLATFLTVFRQAYLLGIEPFFFSEAKEKGAKEKYALLMDIFIILNCLIVMFLMANLQWIAEEYLRNSEYYEGINIVPLLFGGILFLGIYLNLSAWYKLSDQTLMGVYLSVFGAVITIAINYVFIPQYGYWASAWAAFITFFSMALASLVLGQKHYPIPYHLKKISSYLLLTCGLSCLAFYQFRTNYWVGNLLFLVLLGFFAFRERKLLFLIPRNKIMKN